MFEVNDKVVVVTGAATGIGRALAEEAARRGATVALADIDQARAVAAAAEIGAGGATAKGFHVDVTSRESLEALARSVTAAFGGVNVVFNNAAVFSGGPMERTRPEDFDWVFDVNVRGLFNATTAYLPYLRNAAEAGELAHIVNTGSERSIGISPTGGQGACAATKHAVLALSDNLRVELKGSGVGISILCPGRVQTELWSAKQSRPDRFGGRKTRPEAPPGLEDGRTPCETAEAAFQGMDAGDFMIITDVRIREETQRRLDEIRRALDTCDRRLELPA